MYDYQLSEKPTEKFLEDARSFYYDTALSTNKHTLTLLVDFAQKDHILFGSDFPYAPTKTIETHTEMLEKSEIHEGIKQKIARDNAVALMPRFGNV